MRAWALTAIILLAGCSTSDDPVGPDDEGPIAGDTSGPKGDPVSINDEGEMLEGVDETWDFKLNATVQSMEVAVYLHGLADAPLMVKSDVQVSLYQNGSQVANSGGTGTTSIWVDTAGGGDLLFDYTQRVTSNSTLADHAGEWVLALESGPHPTTYSISILAKYE